MHHPVRTVIFSTKSKILRVENSFKIPLIFILRLYKGFKISSVSPEDFDYMVYSQPLAH